VTRRLLFELGTEELPPSDLAAVLGALDDGARRMLEEARLGFAGLRVHSTPRRLALFVDGLQPEQTTVTVTVTGPPKKAAFDADGKPTRAAEGFARAQGVAVGSLITVATERGDYLAAQREERGRPAGEVLPEPLAGLMLSLPFSKQMRWGDGDVRFIRPIRWVLALLDTKVLPVTVAGIAAGPMTFGHRFVAPAPIEITEPSAYLSALERGFVIADVEQRRALVRREVESAAAKTGQRAVIDEATLATVVHLVEYPAAVVGTFSEKYLDLPREVVETPIRRHQKCFTVESLDGRLAPTFVAVSNMPGADPAEIRRGNERVIRARLADADFYFREDLKVSPEHRVDQLRGMVFQERLGTLFEKTERLVALTERLGAGLPAAERQALVRAARLAKSDLASGMVREFPELQGVIGEEYALRAGESPAVARAIREHYLPRAADDRLPATSVGALLSIADKADTIVGCIGIGLMPTGSQDPYALRRQAQGIVQILLGMPLRLSLSALVEEARRLLAPKLTEAEDVTRGRVLDFFRARLTTLLTARGVRPDVAEAVLAAGFDQPALALKRAEALTALMTQPGWEPLVITFKRTINILPSRAVGAVNLARFVNEAERALHAATTECAPRVRLAIETEDYAAALGELASLRPVVDRFFDAVMVMDKDPALQENRLALLRAIAEMLLSVADLRKIQSAS